MVHWVSESLRYPWSVSLNESLRGALRDSWVTHWVKPQVMHWLPSMRIVSMTGWVVHWVSPRVVHRLVTQSIIWVKFSLRSWVIQWVIVWIIMWVSLSGFLGKYCMIPLVSHRVTRWLIVWVVRYWSGWLIDCLSPWVNVCPGQWLLEWVINGVTHALDA